METLYPPVERLPEQSELRVGYVYNPASGNADHLSEQVMTLIRSGVLARGAYHETLPGGLEANEAGLRRVLAIGAGKNPDGTTKRLDALVIFGGDGTVAMLEQLLSDPNLPDEVRDTVLIPVPNGGASDKSRTVFPNGLNLGDLGGLMIEHHTPVRIETTFPDGTMTVHRTTLYDSKGRSAEAARRLNEARRKKTVLRLLGFKRLGNLSIGLQAASGNLEFPVTEQDGEERILQERAISNNPRMGGFEICPGDARSDTFFVFDIEGGGSVELAMGIRQLFSKRFREEVWREYKEFEYTIGHGLGSNTEGGNSHISVSSQHGGENGRSLPFGTHVKATKVGERAIRYAAAA